MLEQLSRPFPPQHVKTRQQAGQTLYYVSIDHVIQRFNEVLGMNWSSEIKETSIVPNGTDAKGRNRFYCMTRTAVHVRNDDGTITTREGIGAAEGTDIDMITKSSAAESLKKCSNFFGISGELWSPARRSFCGNLSGYEHMNPSELRARLSKAVQQWRTEDKTLNSFGSKQEANRAFLKEAFLTEEEIDDIRKRCMEDQPHVQAA